MIRLKLITTFALGTGSVVCVEIFSSYVMHQSLNVLRQHHCGFSVQQLLECLTCFIEGFLEFRLTKCLARPLYLHDSLKHIWIIMVYAFQTLILY